jgi:hypothetical protein
MNTKSILKLAVVVLLTGTASVAYAQAKGGASASVSRSQGPATGNASDVTGPLPSGTAGGAYVPATTGGGTAAPGANANGGTVAAAAITSIGGSLGSSPAAQSVTSLITTGSAGAAATVGAGLTAAGANPGSANALTNALGALAGATRSTAPSLIINLVTTHNTFVVAASEPVLRSQSFAVIHTAVVKLSASITRPQALP